MATSLFRAGSLLGLAAVVVISGCAGDVLSEVQGTVSYHGKPLEQGRVGFYPELGRPAYGDVREGKFTLTTYQPGDGALIGAHRVTVHCEKLSDPNDAFSPAISLIPVRYQKPDTSGLTADVKKGDNLFHFDLTD